MTYEPSVVLHTLSPIRDRLASPTTWLPWLHMAQGDLVGHLMHRAVFGEGSYPGLGQLLW